MLAWRTCASPKRIAARGGLACADVEPEIRKLLMRHSTGDVTEDCYTEREIEQLHEAVCRINWTSRRRA